MCKDIDEFTVGRLSVEHIHTSGILKLLRDDTVIRHISRTYQCKSSDNAVFILYGHDLYDIIFHLDDVIPSGHRQGFGYYIAVYGTVAFCHIFRIVRTGVKAFQEIVINYSLRSQDEFTCRLIVVIGTCRPLIFPGRHKEHIIKGKFLSCIGIEIVELVLYIICCYPVDYLEAQCRCIGSGDPYIPAAAFLPFPVLEDTCELRISGSRSRAQCNGLKTVSII